MSSTIATARPALEGTYLGRYRLRHKLAEGGMASVYLAQLVGERGFERWVVVKVVHPELADDPEYAVMLGDEARVIARIHHPNVASVIDFGMEGDLVYMVMEYLHGQPLSAAARRAWTEERSFPAWFVARAVADAARGLHAAHELADADGRSFELVHRDVSPENILITYDGLAKVIDFGVVSGRGRQTKTKVGTVKGKLSHMAPEQLLGAGLDRRADVWSLGVVLWESTLGRRLFRASSPGETVQKVTNMPIPRPSEVAPGYPAALEAMVMGALERDVERRIPDADTLAHGLESYLYSLGRPAGHGQMARWIRRHFSDRLLVREALLTAPDTPSLPPAESDGEAEGSSSHLLSRSIAATSFAPPAMPTGITRVARPAPPDDAGREAASSSDDMRRELDAELEVLRRQGARRRAIVWTLALVVLALGAAVSYLLLRASPG